MYSSRMSSKTILIQLRLGRVSDYNPTVFPLMKDESTLKAGQIYLEYTLDELIKMEQMSNDRPNFKKDYRKARKRYDQYVFFCTVITPYLKISSLAG